jgi:hypothetical protein
MKMSIYKWYKRFNKAGCIGKGKIPGNRPVIQAKVNNFSVQHPRWRMFEFSPKKSVTANSVYISLFGDLSF